MTAKTSTFDNPAGINTENGIYASTATNARVIYVNFSDVAELPGLVTAVSLKIKHYAVGTGDDNLGVNVTNGNGALNTWACSLNTWGCNDTIHISNIPLSSAVITSTVDLTALYASWDAAKLNSLGAVLRASRTGGQDFTYIGVDHAWIEVVYTPFSPTITPTITLTITGTPPTQTVTPTITQTPTSTQTSTATVTMTFTVTPTATCAGVIRYVGSGQTYTTISAALAAAGACDIIEITSDITENVILNKNVTEIRGSNRNVVWNGIGNNTSRTLEITNGVTQLVRINNITIEHNSGSAATVYLTSFSVAGKVKFYDVTIRHSGGSSNLVADAAPSSQAGQVVFERCRFEASAGDICFWSQSTSAGTTLIANCVFSGGATAIQFASSGAAYTATILNNTIYGAATSGLRINAGCSVINNVFCANAADLDIFGLNAKRADFYNNAFGTETSAGFTPANNNVFGITAANAFTNAAGGNFTLPYGSRLRDSGKYEPYINDDITGAARPQIAHDIGAYEYIQQGDTALYGFEDYTLMGWRGNAGYSASNSGDRAAFGNRSAKLNLSLSGSGWSDTMFYVENVNVAETVEMWVYLPNNAPADIQAEIFILDAGWSWRESGLTALTPGSYTRIQLDTAPLNLVNPCNQIGLFVGSWNVDYSGPIYIDSVNFNNMPPPTPTLTPFTPVCISSDNFDDSSLASFWTAADIGFPPAGSQVEATALTINAAGTGMSFSSDSFRYVWQPVRGHADISLDIINVPSVSADSKSGIMIRQDGSPGAPFAYVCATRDRGYAFITRLSQGAAAAEQFGGSFLNLAGGRVRLLRDGNNFSAYYFNGSGWEQIGTTVNVPLAEDVLAGIAVASVDQVTVGGSTVDNFTVYTDFCAASPTNTPVAASPTETPYYTDTMTMTVSETPVATMTFTVTATPYMTATATVTATSTACGTVLYVCPSGACGGYTTIAAAVAASTSACDIIEITENITELVSLGKNIAEIRGANPGVTWTASGNSRNFYVTSSVTLPLKLTDLRMTHTSGNGQTIQYDAGNAASLYLKNCYLQNTSADIVYTAVNSAGPDYMVFDGCEIVAGASTGLSLRGTTAGQYRIINTVIRNSAAYGIYSGTSANSVFTLLNNTIHGNATGLRIETRGVFRNNLFTMNTDDILIAGSANISDYRYNAFGQANEAGIDWGTNTCCVSGTEYVSAGIDFSLVETAISRNRGDNFMPVAYDKAGIARPQEGVIDIGAYEFVPSPTFTATSTATKTVTPADSPTISPTATATLTHTVTPTVTPTSSATQTVTQTATQTVTETVTHTATPSATQTITATVTPSVTATVTRTVTATATQSATPSATPSVTQTVTTSITQTVTETVTQTATPSVTPTVTETVTATVTQTVTPSVTASVTPTVTATITQTATPSVTASVTQTVTATVTQTVTPSVTATVTETVTATITQTVTPSVTASVTATVTVTITQTATPSVTASVTQTVTQTVTPSVTASVTATVTSTITQTVTPSVTATVTETVTTTVTQTATPSVTASVTPTVTQTATPSVTATVTQTVTTTITHTVTPSVTATVTETVTTTITQTATETVTQTVTATVTQTATPSVTASVTQTVTPSVTETVTETVTTTITQTVTPTVTQTATPSATATVTPTITQTVTPSVTDTVTETATATITQTVTPSVTATVTETVTTTITQTATPSVTATVTRTVTTTITQTLTPSVTSTVTESVTMTITHTVTPSVTATITETETTTITQTATPSATATVTETVTMTVTPSMTVSVTETVTMTVTTTVTATVTHTVTMTITQTVTPSVTETVTQTITATVTQTVTPSVTETVSETVTTTITRTVTSSVTASVTETVTVTVTQTVTNTVTQTATPVITDTATETVTTTISHTVTPTVTPTATQSVTATVTVTETVTTTMTQTATQSITQTVTQTVTGTATQTVTGTVTSTETNTATPTVTGTVTQTITATITQTPGNTATQTATQSITATSTPTATPTDDSTATFTPTPTVTRTATGTFTVTSTPTVTLSGTITPTIEFTYTITRTHTITPTITMTHSITPTITASPTATPAAFAHVEPVTGVAGDLTELKYRVASRNDGLITQLRIRIPSGVTAQAPSSSRSGATAAVVSGEVRVYYDTGWNAFSNPGFDVITFYVTSNTGVKVFTSYLNAISGADCDEPAGYTQEVNFIAPTMTSTPTVTRTATPTCTNTPYQSPTFTSTRTYTVTRTITETHTDTPVYSPTLTPTGTMPTPTNTPTITQTETATDTATDTATPTVTHTFTDTVTPTITVTLTPTVTNTITIKGMDLSWSDFGVSAYSGGMQSAPLMKIYFTNIGGADEPVRGVTLTAVNQFGNFTDMSQHIGTLYAVDNEGNTAGTFVFTGSANAYLEFMPPLNVRLQGTYEITIYADIKDFTSPASFRIGVYSDADVSVDVPVSSSPGYSYPMNSRLISLEVLNKNLYAQGYDLMPPSVSTGQQNVNCYIAAFRNPGSAGGSASLITGVTLTVRDENSNPINASLALSNLRLTDGAGTVYGSAAAGSSPYVYIELSQPAAAGAGATVPVYINADITGNTSNRAAGFRVSLDSAAFTKARDYGYDAQVAVSADSGHSFPFISTAATILNRAVKINTASTDMMPPQISAGQQDVEALNLVLTNVGDTLTASAMVSRINFYITDIAGTPVDPAAFISEISVTAPDGSVYGLASSFSGNKIAVNLVSPVIISGAVPVVLSVKINAASAFSPDAFRVMVNSANDIYAVDSNVFQSVEVSGTFPDISSAAVILAGASVSELNSFAPLLALSLPKGASSAPVMSFAVSNPSAAGTADAEIWKAEFAFSNSSGAAIAADSACGALYLVDSNGVTVAATIAGTSGTAVLYPASPLGLAPGASRSFTLYADIKQQAYAPEFRVSLASLSSAGVRDANSKEETSKTASPSVPWNTGVCSVVPAPADTLIVSHDGTFAPVQAGGGQPDVLMMSVSFYNPAFAGSSSVIIDALTLDITDASGLPVPAMDVLSSVKITSFGGSAVYGQAALGAETLPAASVPFGAPVYVAAGTTFTAYVSADIASSAAGSFKLRLGSPAAVSAQNDPAGAVAVTGLFPLDSGVTAITSLAYDLRVGRLNLMPVSAAAGDTDIGIMELSFQNNSSVAMQVTGVSLTVKTASGAAAPADSCISLLGIYDAAGTLILTAVPGPSGIIYFEPALALAPGGSGTLIVRADLSASAAGGFYVELVSPGHVATDIGASVNPASGQYFGNIRSSAVSVQPRSLELSYHGFPNPFNPASRAMTIEYYAENETEVTINIYTLYGRPVKKIASAAVMPQGLNNSQQWDGTNESGYLVKSGVYLMVLEAKDRVTLRETRLVKKVAVLK